MPLSTMLKNFRFTALLLSLLPTLGLLGQVKSAQVQSQLLDSIALQDVPLGAPGIAVGIVQGGKISYERYGGYANLADSTRLDYRSRFNIASNGKQFTALAVLLLIRQGKLHLDDDIRKFFPNLYPRVSTPIAVRHLLTHTSGIRDVYDLWSLQGLTWWKQSFSNSDALAILQRQSELNFAPGSRYLYSNSNYILLAEIVSKVSGVSFVSFTNEMFRSLGMPNTSFVDNYRIITEPIARPYFNFNTWVGYDWVTNLYGDGNLFSTLKDQLRWEQLIQSGEDGGLPVGLIVQSQQLVDTSLTREYGYGLSHGEYKGQPYRYHEGSTGAWKATTVRFGTNDLSIVTLTNSGKTTPSQQTRQMVDLLYGIKSETKFPTSPTEVGLRLEEDEIVGVYQTQDGFTFRFIKRPDGLYLARAGRNDVRIERESANVFRQVFDKAFKQEFQRNAKGEMTVTAYYTSHAPYTLTRPQADWAGFDPSSLNGRYLNTETGVFLTIKFDTERTYQVKIGKNDRSSANLLTPNLLNFDSYNIDIQRSTTGNVSFIFMNSERSRKVRFERVPK
jgi:CubicO group peptidase (beta-lactamase class C family)